MQLVAYGAQDVYLTGNPQITYFKTIYKRHTNFATESIEQIFQGNPQFGRTVSCPLVRQGDLITRMYLKVTLNDVKTPNGTYAGMSVAWVRKLGFAMLDYVEIEIGGAKIDKHYGHWLSVWYELTHSDNEERGYNAMIGDVEELTKMREVDINGGTTINGYTLFVPLQFWFNRNVGLALPLVALQYHEVRVYVKFNDVTSLVVWSGGPLQNNNHHHVSLFAIKDASILAEYVYLDSEERKRFAQVGHEYLIEQVQFTGTEKVPETKGTGTTGKYKLNFNHPTKEFIWAVKLGAFNGSGVSFSNANVKHLCYTHDDSKWDEAVDEAAAKLAKSMFQITYDTVGSLSSSLSQPSLTSVSNFIVDPMDSSGNTILFDYCNSNPLITHNGLKLKLYVNFVTKNGNVILNTNFINNTPNSNYPVIKVNTKPLWQKTINLASNFSVVELTVVFESVNFNQETNMCDVLTLAEEPRVVNVIEHNLSLVNVSVPISEWNDTRQKVDTLSDIVVIQPHNFGVLLNGKGNPIKDAVIQFNGQDRFSIREGAYFNYVQPYEHHTRTPADGINVYSFALKPELLQPSGTANLSRIDSVYINIVFVDPYRNGVQFLQIDIGKDAVLYIYAFSYNVLRIMSGMGGLAYSN